MRVLVTGDRGFIGKNLTVRLNECEGFSTLSFTRKDSTDLLSALVHQANVIVHLAGENRPADAQSHWLDGQAPKEGQ
jgi:UDP-2-acetamido-2,6-beta-L-arabino-hexul-4-ose reductase